MIKYWYILEFEDKNGIKAKVGFDNLRECEDLYKEYKKEGYKFLSGIKTTKKFDE